MLKVKSAMLDVLEIKVIKMKLSKKPPGVKNGVIIDVSYWIWVDKTRKLAVENQRIFHAINMIKNKRKNNPKIINFIKSIMHSKIKFKEKLLVIADYLEEQGDILGEYSRLMVVNQPKYNKRLRQLEKLMCTNKS